MRVFRLLPVLLLFATLGSFAQSASTKPAAGFSLDNIDKTADPCVED
jgi:hypothetical protein